VVHSLRAKALLGLSGLLLASCIVLLVLLLDRQAEVDSSVREVRYGRSTSLTGKR
jgi:hypothetical protein